MTLVNIRDNGSPENHEVSLKLKFEIQQNEVILRIPEFSFVIDFSPLDYYGEPADIVYYYSSGANLGTIDGFIPTHLRPDTLIHQAVPVVASNSATQLAMYVCNDGSIRVANPYQPAGLIPNGTYRVATTTISYVLDKSKCSCDCKTNSIKPPKNIRATSVSNNYIVDSAVGFPGMPLEYADPFYHDGKIGITIPSRPAVPGITPFNNLQGDWVLQTCSVSNSGEIGAFNVTTVSNLPNGNGGPKVYHCEGSIRVNPNNSNNLAAIQIQFPLNGGPTLFPLLGKLTGAISPNDTILPVTSELANLALVGCLLRIRNNADDNFVEIGRIISTDAGANTVTVDTGVPQGFNAGNDIGVRNRAFMLATSIDGGSTWAIKRLDNLVFVNNPIRADPSLLYDDYGNLWYCAMYVNDGKFPPTQNYNNLSVFIGFAVSADNGVTWREVGKFINFVDNTDPNATEFQFPDFPRMSFGGDGNGGKAMWFSTQSYHTDDTPPTGWKVVVGYFRVTGLDDVFGNIGPIQYQVYDNLSYNTITQPLAHGTGSIVATPSGKVYLFSNSSRYFQGLFAPYTLSVNEKGTNWFTDGTLTANVAVDSDTISVNSELVQLNFVGRPIQIQDGVDEDDNPIFVDVGTIVSANVDLSTFTIDPVTAKAFNQDSIVRVVGITENSFSDVRQIVNRNVQRPFIASQGGFNLLYSENSYDPDIDRLYIFFPENVTLLDRTVQRVSLIYTDDNGLTWSKRIQINDVEEGSRCWCHIQRDTKTGNLLLLWYDSRNNTIDSRSCDTYIAILTKKWLDALPPVCE